MAVFVMGLDEESKVAVARSLVEAPHMSIIAAADPNSRDGQLVVADSYAEAVEYAAALIERGWRACVWEVPSRKP